MNDNEHLLCMFEGRKVVGATYMPDRNEKCGRGIETEMVGWNWPETIASYSFWVLNEEILRRYNKFRVGKNMEEYFVYLGYHVTSKPMTWDECTEANIAENLGLPCEHYGWDSYSDLTGYLWTNYDTHGDGHNLYEELNQIEYGKYLTFRFEVTKKSS